MPAGKQKLQYEVNNSFFLVLTLNFHYRSNLRVTWVFVPLGHFHQGLQFTGLLQHEQWFNHSPGTQGERWTEEMNHAAASKTFYSFFVIHSCTVVLVRLKLFKIISCFSYICVKCCNAMLIEWQCAIVSVFWWHTIILDCKNMQNPTISININKGI